MHCVIVGCGYLGLRVAKQLLERGETVTAMTRQHHPRADWDALGIHTISGDVLNRQSLHALPAADLLIYAVGFDRTANADKRAVYVDGVRNVLTEVRARIPRVIYVSSTSVYGQQAGEIVDESAVCEPDTESGRICLNAEGVVRELYVDSAAAPIRMILRLAGIYGPGRLIARQEQLMKGVPIAGNPLSWLNLVHVEDAARAICIAAARPFPADLYLLSDAMPHQRREFYSAIAHRIGAPKPTFVCADESLLNKRCDSRRIQWELPLKLQFPDAVQALPDLF